MELYVGPLSAHTTVADLQHFFKSFRKKASFSITKLIRNGGPHYFGLVEFDSDKLAARAIKKLHTGRLKGHRVIVREYEYRASNNDRRALNWRNLEWSKIERRNQERREKSRISKERDPGFDAYDNLAVKHL